MVPRTNVRSRTTGGPGHPHQRPHQTGTSRARIWSCVLTKVHAFLLRPRLCQLAGVGAGLGDQTPGVTPLGCLRHATPRTPLRLAIMPDYLPSFPAHDDGTCMPEEAALGAVDLPSLRFAAEVLEGIVKRMGKDKTST